jgi:hypothetical protein
MVIPVRVNGAELPPKAALTDDIRGLLDHQAASVTNSGFRHEMGGLVRDLRKIIPIARSFRELASIAAAILLLLVALGLFSCRHFFMEVREQSITTFTPNKAGNDCILCRATFL